jgi:hypothetical protein
MDRTLSQTIADLTECQLAVEVTRSADQDMTVTVRDPASGLQERRSFMPEQADKAANWLHGTALSAFPGSRYGGRDELQDPLDTLSEPMRQGLAGRG